VPSEFAAGPAVFSEPFTYANGPLSASPDWTGPLFGDTSLVVAGNVLTCTDATGGQSNATEVNTFGDGDYVIEVPNVGSTGASEFYFCFQNASNYYSLILTTPSHLLELYRVVGGVYTLIGGSSNAILSGQAIGVRKVGSVIDLYQRVSGTWVHRTQVTDATYSSGAIAKWSGSAARTFDNLAFRDFAYNVAFAPTINLTAGGPPAVEVQLPGEMTASITAAVGAEVGDPHPPSQVGFVVTITMTAGGRVLLQEPLGRDRGQSPVQIVGPLGGGQQDPSVLVRGQRGLRSGRLLARMRR
jgi:hypothetical protein